MDRENVQLCTYLDFVEMPDMEDTVFIRMTFALETWETIGADRVGIRVGKENYVFEVSPGSLTPKDREVALKARNSFIFCQYEQFCYCTTSHIVV